jgi:hypothetical protein
MPLQVRTVTEVSAADLVIGATAGEGDKHHYVPVFYTKEWAGLDGRVCEYSRPFREVKPDASIPMGLATSAASTLSRATILAFQNSSNASSSR